MYADPSLIRDHVVKIRLKPDEQALLEKAAAKHGLPLASWARMVIVTKVPEKIVDSIRVVS